MCEVLHYTDMFAFMHTRYHNYVFCLYNSHLCGFAINQCGGYCTHTNRIFINPLHIIFISEDVFDIASCVCEIYISVNL